MKAQTLLPIVASLAVGAVLLHPKTAWIPGMALNAARVALTGGVEAAKRRAVESSPSDAGLALAQAGNDLMKVRALTVRFPDDASVRAAALRLAVSEGGVDLNLVDRADGQKPVEAARLAANARKAVLLLADAQAGARLDPDNAYFSFMGAVGLCAANRLDDARSAFHVASSKPRYDDYVSSSVQAKLRLSEAAQGRIPMLPSISIFASELYPHFASMRSLSRLLQKRAIACERAGDDAGGFAIRRDIMALGGLVRRDSSTFIGTLVGIAIHAVGTGQPGGQELETWKKLQRPGETDDAAKARRMTLADERWKAWCLKIGHPEAADALARNIALKNSLSGLMERVENRSPLSLSVALREAVLFGLSGYFLLLAGCFALMGRFWARRMPAETSVPLLHPSRVVLTLLAGTVVGAAALLFGATRASVGLMTTGVALLLTASQLPEFLFWRLARRAGVPRTLTARKNYAASGAVVGWSCLLLWAGFQVGIAQQENVWQAGMERYVTNELGELMRLDGKPWPPK